MTQQPPHPLAPYEAAQRAALVKNLLGVALIAVGLAGLLAVAWSVDWRLAAALLCAAAVGGGYLLATTEA